MRETDLAVNKVYEASNKIFNANASAIPGTEKEDIANARPIVIGAKYKESKESGMPDSALHSFKKINCEDQDEVLTVIGDFRDSLVQREYFTEECNLVFVKVNAVRLQYVTKHINREGFFLSDIIFWASGRLDKYHEELSKAEESIRMKV